MEETWKKEILLLFVLYVNWTVNAEDVARFLGSKYVQAIVLEALDESVVPFLPRVKVSRDTGIMLSWFLILVWCHGFFSDRP